jgi:hypothetical protein
MSVKSTNLARSKIFSLFLCYLFLCFFASLFVVFQKLGTGAVVQLDEEIMQLLQTLQEKDFHGTAISQEVLELEVSQFMFLFFFFFFFFCTVFSPV